jgi:hypothetical protein
MDRIRGQGGTSRLGLLGLAPIDGSSNLLSLAFSTGSGAQAISSANITKDHE